MTPPGLTIRRVVVDGEPYYPVVADGRYLREAEVATLAASLDPECAGRVRKLQGTLITPEIPRPARPGQPFHRGPRALDVARVRCWPNIPVLHAEFLVGRVETVSRVEDHRIEATIRLDSTLLSAVVWRALSDGTLGDLCAAVAMGADDDDEGRDGGVVAWVNVDASGAGCLAHATVQGLSEEPDDVATLAPLDLAGVRTMLGLDDDTVVPASLRKVYEAELEAVFRATGEWVGP